MESEFLDKVEDNAVVRIWSEKTQLEKGDSLTKGYTSELLDFTYINVTQNNFQELKEIWAQWDDEVKQLFYSNYGDLPYLFDIKVDEHLFRALAQFWNPAYSCFTFEEIDLVDKVFSKAVNVPTFVKKLVNILGMIHPDTKKKVDVFALSTYGLMIFPRALGYIDEAVTDLFDRLDKRVTPVPVILAETFRSLSACRRAGEGRFIGCAQLLLVWFHSHFWKVDKVSYRVFSNDYSPLKELAAMSRRDNITMEKWIMILQNLKDEDVEWKAPWIMPDKILYRCGDFD
ncbi:hypothetical protein Gohar_000055 [Gossypium harknessii]|uniref:DUF7745 domain-containing protein n=1 Tax=Gossypium harknessii TaxID=34285 RepID=A0A7J9I8N2_9ROSI|nr:hypothetical protein [Gossypium harknessii]